MDENYFLHLPFLKAIVSCILVITQESSRLGDESYPVAG